MPFLDREGWIRRLGDRGRFLGGLGVELKLIGNFII